ncbi:MAG: DUF4097 family beta strand repeat-containing protein [Thermoanaerobaculia bacterium]
MRRCETDKPLRRTFFVVALIAAVAAMFHPFAAVAVERQKTLDRVWTPRAGQSLEFENLVGRLAVAPSSGGDLRIVVTVHARAASEAEAEHLAGLVTLRVEEVGDRLKVHADYPLERFDVYHYPASERAEDDLSTWLAWLGVDRNEVRYQGDRVSVVSSESHRSVTLWADARLEIPRELGFKARNLVGTIESRDVAADQAFDASSADVDVRAGRGALVISTGSGDIQVEHQTGEVSAETGSGDVVISDQQGSAAMNTGSGDVSISRATGETFFAKTGSGDVRLDELRGSVEADTGSGDVNGSDLVLGRRVKADTGSGNVRLSGDFSQVDTAVLETGSGDVTLRLAAVPSARLVISTGSGDIRVDVPSLSVLRSRSSYFEGRIGGGSANLSIDTGSGDVAVTGP